MIIEVEGDILLTGAEAIAHGVAPNDPFDQGLALAVRQQWPDMYRDFRHHGHEKHPGAGDLWAWQGPEKRVYHLFTQAGGYEHGAKPGKATLANVNHSLRALRHALEQDGVSSLAIPRLATGVGELAWKDVLPEVTKHLGDAPCKVYVYHVYHPGVRATEE